MKVTNSSVRSGESSRDTARRRSQELSKIRERLSSGDSEHQMADELKMLPKQVREELIKELKFTVHIPADKNLAMKADLCLPWNKLRVMRRSLLYTMTNDIFNALKILQMAETMEYHSC